MTATRETWLEERKKGLGGSDAAAVVGLNPYMTNIELWEIKTGRREQADISEKEAVIYGKAAEEPLRELFKLDYPEYEVTHEEYTIIKNKDHPFLFASLDGELVDRKTGELGILEIKTTNILQSMQMEKWNDRVPNNYYCQILHYLGVTGYAFAVLKAHLRKMYEGHPRITTRHYFFDRKDFENDIQSLQEAEMLFWENHVLKDVPPPLILPPL